jgi:hypothetical protein
MRPATVIRAPTASPRDTGKSEGITFDEYKKFVSEYTAEKVSKLSGVPVVKLNELAELYADPKIKVVSFWTMGFNQHTRGTWANNLCLQHPPADRQDLRAGQQPVLADRPAVRLRHGARSRHFLAPPAGRHGGHQP